jgi:hypothetical protein
MAKIDNKEPEVKLNNNPTEGFNRKEKYYGNLDELKYDLITKLAEPDNWENISVVDDKYNMYDLRQIGRVVIDERHFYLTELLDDYYDSKSGSLVDFELFPDSEGYMELDIVDDEKIIDNVVEKIANSFEEDSENDESKKEAKLKKEVEATNGKKPKKEKQVKDSKGEKDGK